MLALDIRKQKFL